jgi:hypothetical protein
MSSGVLCLCLCLPQTWHAFLQSASDLSVHLCKLLIVLWQNFLLQLCSLCPAGLLCVSPVFAGWVATPGDGHILEVGSARVCRLAAQLACC